MSMIASVIGAEDSGGLELIRYCGEGSRHCDLPGAALQEILLLEQKLLSNRGAQELMERTGVEPAPK
jgi:hypothetical protein